MKKIFIIAILFTILCGGGQEQTPSEVPETETPQIAKYVLMVIAINDFRDEEFKEPYDLFSKSGISVTVASTDTTQAKGMLGMIVEPDITLEQVNVDSFDALVVVGGTGCQTLWDNKILHRIVQDFNEENKLIAAICIAPIVLGRAGILKDKKATVYPSVQDDIEKCGAVYTGADVETCGNIITSSGPKAANDFATTILKTLSE